MQKERNPMRQHGAPLITAPAVLCKQDHDTAQETGNTTSLLACYSIRTESVVAYAESLCIPVRRATDSMMRGFAQGELNKVGAQVRRKLWPIVKHACKQLADGEIDAVEVLNHWRGSIAMRCLYGPINDDRQAIGRYVAIRIDIDGTLRWGEFPASEQVTQRANRAWSLTRVQPGKCHAVQ